VLGAGRLGTLVAQAKILVPTFVAINLPNKLPGRYGATRADQLSVNAVLNPPNATGLPGLMARQISPALDLPSLLLRRTFWARKLVGVELAKDAEVYPFHAVFIDELPLLSGKGVGTEGTEESGGLRADKTPDKTGQNSFD
jgi:hypothetical protein